MKLRNKKTGEILGGETQILSPILLRNDACVIYEYDSITELNEEWEDYEPKEPLIKDEKVRKAIRAFAELQDSETIRFEKTYNDKSVITRADNGYAMMWLRDKSGLENIKYREDYTIAELCGEEE